jgi:glyoxylase-like metal-dependent hydrolase (beta-lactamase superfamily II)
LSPYSKVKKTRASTGLNNLSFPSNMRVFLIRDFGEVRSVELGYSPVGRPPLTSRFYLVDDILVDTGIKHCQSQVVELIRRRPVSAIYLTHCHEDHSGNACALKLEFGIPVLGHPITVQKMQSPGPIFPYQKLTWGSATGVEMESLQGNIETEHYCLHPIHTPGHSRDHMVFWEPNQGWLFSGDVYLGDKIKYFRADEVFQDQMTSLEKLIQLDFDALFCSHNPRPQKGKIHLKRKLEYFYTLAGGVRKLRDKGHSSKAIMKELGIREATLLKVLCYGNLSAENLIRSAIKSIPVD